MDTQETQTIPEHRTPNQQRLDGLHRQLQAQGSSLRHVSWAPGAENLDPEARRGALADALEPYLAGQGTQVYALHDELLSGDELVQRVYELEDRLKALGQDPADLSDDDIQQIDDSTMFHESPDWAVRFARAVLREAYARQAARAGGAQSSGTPEA